MTAFDDRPVCGDDPCNHTPAHVSVAKDRARNPQDYNPSMNGESTAMTTSPLVTRRTHSDPVVILTYRHPDHERRVATEAMPLSAVGDLLPGLDDQGAHSLRLYTQRRLLEEHGGRYGWERCSMCGHEYTPLGWEAFSEHDVDCPYAAWVWEGAG